MAKFKLTSRPDANSIALAGAAGGLAISAILAISRALGLTRLNLELIAGSFFTGSVGTGSWILGLLLHLLVSALIASAYAAGFRLLRRTGWSQGMSFAIPHWIVTGFYLGMLPYFHPVIPGLIAPPGYLAASGGIGSFLSLLVALLAYGAVVGVMCRLTPEEKLVGRVDEEEQELEAAAA